MSFEGIPVAALDFYEDLEGDNSKAFWAAHKSTYDEAVRAPLEAFSAEAAGILGPAKLFRPYRDVRFSKDKTPYKTAQGVWFTETSRYVQVSAAGLLVAGGYWQTSPEQVARLRSAVADDAHGPALERARAALAKKAFTVGGDALVRVPTGYAKDHPRADLLRLKTLTVSKAIGCPTWLSTPRAKVEVLALLKAMAPVIDWLDDRVGRD